MAIKTTEEKRVVRIQKMLGKPIKFKNGGGVATAFDSKKNLVSVATGRGKPIKVAETSIITRGSLYFVDQDLPEANIPKPAKQLITKTVNTINKKGESKMESLMNAAVNSSIEDVERAFDSVLQDGS